LATQRINGKLIGLQVKLT